MRYSSSVVPLAFVVESCNDADRALLSIARRTPTPFACCNTASNFDRSTSICRSMSKYILARISFTPSSVISATTASASENCLNSKASICLLVTTMAALLLVLAFVKVLNLLDIPTTLFFIVYGSWMQIISVLSSTVICMRLAVAALECCRLICMHRMWLCFVCFPVLYVASSLQANAISIVYVLPVPF